MKIGYTKVLGIALLTFNLFICCLSAVFVRTEETIPITLVGAFWLFFLAGVLFLTRTYIEIVNNTLIIKSLIGSGGRKYSFTSVKDFSMDDGSVLLLVNGNRQKLPLSPWLADKRSWNAFIQWVETGNNSTS